ncbi:nucleotidyl transferase AbiEii/AbiGii toxin family protein [Actinoplanes campanulatus]|uniref:nucleotidyl transferase AbiEii/AbiGii toxin family protein n=1 Tax=Actinoplanes campanulatus TaxID=113559 RepID=UPI0016062474|nr:nucleotidyl transferase AbiEii/AbiGii toxin family protein [Actinoplanes campanulatus]
MESVDAFHLQVARTALAVANRYGFALGGGLALILHGIVSRPTEDVDVFGEEGCSVVGAAAAVTAALQDAGIRVEPVDMSSEVVDLDYLMAELVAYRPDGRAVRLSFGHLSRTRQPVLLDIGPVMAVDDLIAWKVAALVNRAEVRDFVDVAAFLADRSPSTLLALARTVDPGLFEEDVAAAGRRLDQTPDRAFAAYGLDARQVAQMRARFHDWPRS